jgi:hypothetical protein
MSDKKPMSDLYEKLYFHEIDAREKLHSRVGVPLAVLISIVGGMGFMIQNLQRDQTGTAANLFYCCFGLAFLFVALGAYYLKSAASGHDYQFLAPATGWETHRTDCEKRYAEFDDKDQLIDNGVRGALVAEYIRCGSINALVNDSRSKCLFLTIKFLILAAFFVLLAFVVFFFGGLDKAMHPKPLKVIVVQPVEMKGIGMASERPVPPPPPPPPARVVREDKRPHSPPPPPKEHKNGH